MRDARAIFSPAKQLLHFQDGRNLEQLQHFYNHDRQLKDTAAFSNHVADPPPLAFRSYTYADIPKEMQGVRS